MLQVLQKQNAIRSLTGNGIKSHFQHSRHDPSRQPASLFCFYLAKPGGVPMAPSVPQPPQEVGTSSQKHASNTRATKLPLPPAAPRDDKPQIDWAGLRPPARLVRPAARSAAQEGKGHSPEPKIDPDPPAHSPVAPRPPVLPPPVKDKIYSKQEPAQMLDSPALPEWIRALASFNVLGSPVIIGGLSDYEQQPFWATRVAALKHVPPLFEAIKHVKTQDGDRPHLGATSVRRVLTKKKARSPLLPVRTPPTRSLRRRPRCMALWEHASVACGWSRLWQNTFRATRSST